MKNKFYTIVAYGIFFSCATTIPLKFPKFPEDTQGKKLRSVLEGKKKVAVIAKELPPAVQRGLDKRGLASEWKETIRAAMKTTLEEYGYYSVIDIDSRNQRYEELARTQTGLTRTQLSLGQEFAVDHLFFVNMTAVPRVECKIEMLIDLIAATSAALQLAMAATGKDTETDSKDITRPTGVLYLTVFVEGTLVNIETGKSISYSVQEPFRLENQVGNTECPSELMAFSKALESSTKKIADKLSPRVVTVPLPLEEDDETIQAGDKKTINSLLKDGVQWVEAGDVEQAINSWQSALDESGGTSASAFWNLAIAKWYMGDMEQSQKYFEQAGQIGGAKFMDAKKRKIFALFKQEKKRLEEEKD
ncbi:MAG: tetratricopeptide repeat protein [Leptonema sp. (in: bacteria)]